MEVLKDKVEYCLFIYMFIVANDLVALVMFMFLFGVEE